MNAWLIIYGIVMILVFNTISAYGLKQVKVIKTKTAKLIVLIPPIAFIYLGIWAIKEILSAVPNYFKD